MPIHDASHSLQKFWKNRRDEYRALTILFLISTYAFEAAIDLPNPPFFKHSVIEAMKVLNP